MRDKKHIKAKSKVLLSYLALILLIIILILLNNQNMNLISDVGLFLIIIIIAISDVLGSSSWEKIENKRNKKKVFSGLFIILQNQLYQLSGLKVEFKSIEGIMIFSTSLILIIIIYYRFSENFLSNAFENGGLLWKEKNGSVEE